MGVNRLVDTWTGAVSYALRAPFMKFLAARHRPATDLAAKAPTFVKTRREHEIPGYGAMD